MLLLGCKFNSSVIQSLALESNSSRCFNILSSYKRFLNCLSLQEDKNKAAALKNAYVLMGKHQLELAIAFFLLGGDASSAVSVCAKNLGDEQLALVICRLAEGYGGPLERNLISRFLLPSAVSRGDFWMASFLEVGTYDIISAR